MDTHFLTLWQATLEQSLDERASRILDQRYCFSEGKVNTLQSIGDVEQISRERVRQIIVKSLRKIVGKANRAINNQQINTPEAALVSYVRSIVIPEEDGHIDRLAAYLVNDFGHLPPSRTSMDLLVQMLYKTKKEKEARLDEALMSMQVMLGELRAVRPNSKGEARPKQERPSTADRAKQAEIVQWLALSKYATATDPVPGFCIRQGEHVRLKNGNRYEILEWLKREGIHEGISVAGYYVIRDATDSRYSDSLLFLSANSIKSSSQEVWESPSDDRQDMNREQGMPERAYAPWNKHEDRELTWLFESGLSQRHLANHFSRQSSAIRSRLKKLGLK
ncbi:MAG: hypothetical protein KDD92_13815 [Caldilineaceae bacterium]|nr:hypothetical protein [Caldilineaceae bacterium]